MKTIYILTWYPTNCIHNYNVKKNIFLGKIKYFDTYTTGTGFTKFVWFFSQIVLDVFKV